MARPSRLAPSTFAIACAAIALGLSTNCAAVDVVVDFESAHLVPISGWTVATIAITVALVARRALRSPRVRRLPIVMLAALLAAGTAALTSPSTVVSDARADDPTELSLAVGGGRFTIPASALFSMVMSGSGYAIPVVNRTGEAVVIMDRRFENNASTNPTVFYSPSIPEMTGCVIGQTLAAGGKCYIFVAASAHW